MATKRKLTKIVWLLPESHSKAKLLAALLGKQINEAVDIALTMMLEEVQGTEKKEKPKPRTKK